MKFLTFFTIFLGLSPEIQLQNLHTFNLINKNFQQSQIEFRKTSQASKGKARKRCCT